MREIKKFAAVNRGGAVCLTVITAGLLLFSGSGLAQIYTLTDGGSTAIVNAGNTGTLGMNNWTVGGQNQLNQQWFWVSVNGGYAQPINQIGTLTPNQVAPNDLQLSYAGSPLTVNAEYVLSGNGVGSGSADIMEYLSVVNNGVSPITLSFYQYSNFNLLGNNNNTVSLSGGPGGWTGAQQTTGGPGGSGLAEVIDAPNASFGEAALVGQTLNELNTVANLNLNNNPSAGPGDVTWAFQWTAVLQGGQSLDIIKDKGVSISAVPEPSTLAIIALGLGACGLARRRQSSH
jgi:PEP-CTERM motif